MSSPWRRRRDATTLRRLRASGAWSASGGRRSARRRGCARGEWPTGLRLWARNLERFRERTVFENHATRWLSDFWIMPPRAALARLPETLAQEPSPQGASPGEPSSRERRGSPQRFGQALRPRRSDAARPAQDARLDVDGGFRRWTRPRAVEAPVERGIDVVNGLLPRGLRGEGGGGGGGARGGVKWAARSRRAQRRQDEKDGCTG